MKTVTVTDEAQFLLTADDHETDAAVQAQMRQVLDRGRATRIVAAS